MSILTVTTGELGYWYITRDDQVIAGPYATKAEAWAAAKWPEHLERPSPQARPRRRRPT